MLLTVDIDISKDEITKLLKDDVGWKSEYDELFKREELITILCLEGSCADEQDLKEMFERILKEYHERNNNKESR